MNLTRIFNVIVLLTFLLLTGCKLTTMDSSVRIISAKEYYPRLVEEARAWKADAYLDNILIWLSTSPVPLRSHFLSPSEEYESISVYFLQDGTITTKIHVHENPVYQRKPINEEDWKIDSQEALNLLLDEAGNPFIELDQPTFDSIFLERFLATETQPVVWHLAIISNLDEGYDHYYLDAVGGELLHLTPDIPTRFPTTTP